MPATAPGIGVRSESAITVLLVDDQYMIGEAIRRALLDQPDIRYHYCAEPAGVVALIKEVKPTVILQDLVMPGVDGLELVRRYRSDPAIDGIPIVVLSAKEEPAVKSEAFKVGANDYLVKLPDRVELIARVRYHSLAYLAQLQRDDAYRALHESQQQLMEKNLELLRLSKVDGLTGLSNRRYFNEYLEAEWKRATRSQEPLSILMIDVDHFKQYNDTYGHVAGDQVLKKIALALKDCCQRSTDLAARFGGEEFIIILPNTPAFNISFIGNKICRAVEDLNIPHVASSIGEFLTISVGAATAIPEPGEPFSALVDAADRALYEAKRMGRNRLVAHCLGIGGQ
jgi:two-component system, chemotaxis family, response regulator WspR